MNPFAIAPMVMAGLCVFAGAGTLSVYVHQRNQRANLTFPIMCILMAVYDILCAGLYGSSSLEQGVRWQRAQFVLLPLCSAGLLNFIGDYTGKVSLRARIGFTAYLVVESVCAVFLGGGTVVDLTHPLIKTVTLPFGLSVVYYEAAPGVIANLQSIAGLTVIAYCWWCYVRLLREGPRDKAGPLLAVLIVTSFAVVSDTAVSSGLYRFIYLIEYAFMATVLMMAFSLSAQVIGAVHVKDALDRSEKRYRALVENVGEGVAIMDERQCFSFVNPVTESIFSVAPGGLTGKCLGSLLEPDQLAVLGLQVERRKRGERSVYELRVRAADGKIKVVQVTATPQTGDSWEFLGTFAIFRDVTEQRLLEESLRQAQKMEAVGRLAGGIAHDFNNIITIINGYSEILADTLPADHPLQEHIGGIKEAGERAAALTRQLLVFGRRQRLDVQPVRINQILNDLRMPLPRLIGEDVRIQIDLDAGAGWVIADKRQIEEVVINLAANARDAMPEGGTLTLRTKAVLVGNGPGSVAGTRLTPGEYVSLTVSDTGLGMSADVVEHLFEPFFTTKAPGRGTGLGLALVYGIVTQSGGDITVKSAPGEGTTITLYLPRAERAPVEVSAASDGAKPGGTESILLLEDEDTVRRLVARQLRALGYTVLEASRGQQALALLTANENQVDLLMTDVVMTEMNGPAVARAAAALRPGIRVLYMSGYPGRGAQMLNELGDGTLLLEKPFSRDTLARKVREALKRH